MLGTGRSLKIGHLTADSSSRCGGHANGHPRAYPKTRLRLFSNPSTLERRAVFKGFRISGQLKPDRLTRPRDRHPELNLWSDGFFADVRDVPDKASQSIRLSGVWLVPSPR